MNVIKDCLRSHSKWQIWMTPKAILYDVFILSILQPGGVHAQSHVMKCFSGICMLLVQLSVHVCSEKFEWSLLCHLNLCAYNEKF